MYIDNKSISFCRFSGFFLYFIVPDNNVNINLTSSTVTRVQHRYYRRIHRASQWKAAIPTSLYITQTISTTIRSRRSACSALSRAKRRRAFAHDNGFCETSGTGPHVFWGVFKTARASSGVHKRRKRVVHHCTYQTAIKGARIMCDRHCRHTASRASALAAGVKRYLCAGVLYNYCTSVYCTSRVRRIAQRNP